MPLVRGLAEKEHSAALDQLTSSISAIMKLDARTDESPFSKVKSLISDRTLKTTEKKENLESDVANMKFDAGAGEDPFAGLKGLITELISQLQREALDADTGKHSSTLETAVPMFYRVCERRSP